MSRFDMCVPNPASLIREEMPMQLKIWHYVAVVLLLSAGLFGSAVGAIEYVGVKTDAIKLPRQVAEEQNRDPMTLAVPGDLRYWGAYKLSMIARQNPDVVFVGSSRSGEFRSAMFKPYSFYNAGFTSWTLDQMTEMVDRIMTVSKPKVIIATVDYFMFTNAYAGSVEDRAMHFDRDWRFRYDSFFNFIKVLTARPQVFKDFVLPRLLGREAGSLDGLKLVGINAFSDKFGFRFDGSYSYAEGQLRMAPRQIAENKGLIEMAPGGPEIDAKQMNSLERLGTLARQRGVTLVAVQLPYWKASVDFLNTDVQYRHYAGVWRQFESDAMRHKFEELGIPYFDLCCISLSAKKEEFIDAVHIGERGMIEVLLTLAQDQRFRTLFPALEVDRLKADLDTAQKGNNIFNVYGNRF